MGERGDVDMIHDFLLCNQALNEGKSRPQPRSRRRPPPREDLKIQQPSWGECSAELRSAWIRENPDVKDKIVTQFRGSKSPTKAPVPILKRSSYNVELADSDGYDSEATQNTEGTWQLNSNSVMYDTTDDDTNGEGVLVGTELNVNAAASGRPCCRQLRKESNSTSTNT